MTQNEHSAPRVRSCPPCSSTVARTEVVASVLNRSDCPSCHYHLFDVCEGACDECTERKVHCGEFSRCMNEL